MCEEFCWFFLINRVAAPFIYMGIKYVDFALNTHSLFSSLMYVKCLPSRVSFDPQKSHDYNV